MRQVFESIRSIVTRGRVVASSMGIKRTMLQLTGLNGESKDKIELMLPYGMSALPGKGGDLILYQVGGSRAHLVALSADDPTLRITDLQAGEFGFRDANGQQVVFRGDHLEVTTPLKLIANVTGDCDVTIGGQANINVTGKTILTCNDVELGAAGGKKVVLDGDPVVGGGGGHVQASSTKVKAT